MDTHRGHAALIPPACIAAVMRFCIGIQIAQFLALPMIAIGVMKQRG